MIVCLYGRDAAPFVEPVARDLQEAAAALGAELIPLTVEAAVSDPRRWAGAERVYVLPFDVPPRPPAGLPATAALLVHALFPHAEIVNSLAVHDLCWDKLATAERLLSRGLPMPETLITDLPADARAFVFEHGHAILKEPHSCAGQGHLVVFPDPEGNVCGEARGRRYVLDWQPRGTRRVLDGGILSCPAPFYLQRLVGIGRDGALAPAQVLRAYLVEGQILFWTERYRERYRRPSDFIVSVALGARYRFLSAVSEEARKTALRTAEVLGLRVGVVDLVRTGSEGPYVLEADTDGRHMMIDRQFKHIPDYRPAFDFDFALAEALTAPAVQPMRQTHG